MQTGKRADTGNVPGVLFSPDTADLMWLRRNGYQCRRAQTERSSATQQRLLA
ncbi:hypothetical protein IE980_09075 [Klebsiella pneumoniae]|uniref:Uncharacterized protein n=1 Tax=Klebsiella pneumoniae TaxID=573 RepID=A0A927E2K6_KLEPN|nr:hypothetical protein [Klebsiella pneumoniae]